MNESIMPLVEENRALHERVKRLEYELSQQAVRIDQMLEAGWPNPKMVAWVEVDAHPILAFDRLERHRLVVTALAERLVDQIDTLPMKAMVHALRGPVHRYAFLKVAR